MKLLTKSYQFIVAALLLVIFCQPIHAQTQESQMFFEDDNIVELTMDEREKYENIIDEGTELTPGVPGSFEETTNLMQTTMETTSDQFSASESTSEMLTTDNKISMDTAFEASSSQINSTVTNSSQQPIISKNTRPDTSEQHYRYRELLIKKVIKETANIFSTKNVWRIIIIFLDETPLKVYSSLVAPIGLEWMDYLAHRVAGE